MIERTSQILGLCVAGLAISLTGTFFSNVDPKKKFYAYRVQIGCLFFSLVFLLSRFLWLQLTPVFSRTSLTGRIFKRVLLLVLVLGSFCVVLGQILVGPEPYLITRVAYLCFGFMIITSFNLLVWNVLSSVTSHLKLPWQRSQGRDGNKSFVLLASLCISILMCISGVIMALREQEIVDVKVEILKLPASLNATRIVQLSDIHLGPTVGKSAIESIVIRVMDLKPDIVVITGDLVDTSAKSLLQAAAPLAQLRARYGCYFVTGNHEYIAGNVDFWFTELEKLGITPLHNTKVKIASPTEPSDFLYLAGVDDIQANPHLFPGHGMKLQQALQDRNPNYPTVLLAHQPHAAKQAINSYSNIDLILSGHTHGGQFFPLQIPVYLWNPFFAGLYKMKNTWVYVSSGTVYWGTPLRIGSKAEITVITLLKK